MAMPTSGPIEYFDGFDDYNTAQLPRYWSVFGSPTIGSGNGRNGTNALTISATSSRPTLALPAVATRTVGVAFRATGTAGPADPIIYFMDGASTQVNVQLATDGTLTVTRAGVAISSASASTLSLAIWNYIEFSATIHPSAGAYTLKVNGSTWLSATGVNTRATANSTTSGVGLWGLNTGVAHYDDFYSRGDGTFLGDVRVETRLPTGNGATNNFTRGGTDSGANWSQVDETPANDDTDYITSAVAGDIDLFTYPALFTASGTVLAVMPIAVAKNDTAGSVTAATMVRSSATNYPGTTQTIGSTTYGAYGEILGNNPATSAAWTIAAVNAAQFGLKRVS